MSDVTIVLPTYNRAAFLPDAFASIAGQTFANWNLVIVDDGSTDDTPRVLEELAANIRQPVSYVRQDNAGAYAARNRGLDLATGRYIAFFDSDDVWLPHHLANCVNALGAHSDIDWVYGASRVAERASGHVLTPSSFVGDGRPRPFRHLRTTRRGALHVIDDKRVIEVAILRGLYCGLQNSVIRATVFRSERFHTGYCQLEGKAAALASSRSAEDQLFTIRALLNGNRLAYFDDVHVEYCIHNSNSSAAATETRSVDHQLLTFRPLARGFEELGAESPFSRRQRRALARRLAREYFWHIGYSIYWQNGRRPEALASFRRGLRTWPWSVRCWKTFVAAGLRTSLRGAIG